MSSEQPTIELQTVGEILDGLSHRTPAETVVITIDREGGEDAITRAELTGWSDRIRHALVEKGITVGDLVPIHLPTSTGFIAAAIGIFKAGGTPMPVSNRLPESELDHLLELAEAKVVISNALTTNQSLNIDSLRNASSNDDGTEKPEQPLIPATIGLRSPSAPPFSLRWPLSGLFRAQSAGFSSRDGLPH